MLDVDGDSLTSLRRAPLAELSNRIFTVLLELMNAPAIRDASELNLTVTVSESRFFFKYIDQVKSQVEES